MSDEIRYQFYKRKQCFKSQKFKDSDGTFKFVFLETCGSVVDAAKIPMKKLMKEEPKLQKKY